MQKKITIARVLLVKSVVIEYSKDKCIYHVFESYRTLRWIDKYLLLIHCAVFTLSILSQLYQCLNDEVKNIILFSGP